MNDYSNILLNYVIFMYIINRFVNYLNRVVNYINRFVNYIIKFLSKYFDT